MKDEIDLHDDVQEELKWQNYIDIRDSRTPSALLPKGCTNCNVGDRWTQEDTEKIIAMIKPGITIEEMARAVNRSADGIIGRLNLLGLVTYNNPLWRNRTLMWTKQLKKTKLEYRYKYKPSKAVFALQDFMRDNWYQMGWDMGQNGYLLPEKMRQSKVELGYFVAPYKRRLSAKEREKVQKLKESALLRK